MYGRIECCELVVPAGWVVWCVSLGGKNGIDVRATDSCVSLLCAAITIWSEIKHTTRLRTLSVLCAVSLISLQINSFVRWIDRELLLKTVTLDGNTSLAALKIILQNT